MNRLEAQLKRLGVYSENGEEEGFTITDYMHRRGDPIARIVAGENGEESGWYFADAAASALANLSVPENKVQAIHLIWQAIAGAET